MNHLRTLIANADTGLQTASSHLENPKEVARQIGGAYRDAADVDRYRLSDSIRETGESLKDDVTMTQNGLETTRDGLLAEQQNVEEMAEYGHKVAELAAAMRAGMNPASPTARAGGRAAESGNGAQDPRGRAAQRETDTSYKR